MSHMSVNYCFANNIPLNYRLPS